MEYTDRLLALPELIQNADVAVAQWKDSVAQAAAQLAIEEPDVMLAAVADGKDADTRKMQRESAASNNERIVDLRNTHRGAQLNHAHCAAQRDRLIREYDALLALVKAG